ncbi:MAG: GreA/GreB family elongation factor, partial [Stellaceae bacterium]
TGQGVERSVTIVGIDETDSSAGRGSWVSPIARALLKAREGDMVELKAPTGIETIEVVAIAYPDASEASRG